LEAGKSPIYKNNKIKIIKNNSNILKTYVELIKSAKKLIIVQTYIIKNGVFFSTIANELIKKAQMGIKVYFMYD
jgi:cardiolipin synthase